MKRSGIFCAFLLVLIFLNSISPALADDSRHIAVRDIDVCQAIKAIADSFQHNFIAQSGISGAVSLAIEAYDMHDAMEQIEQKTGLGLILHGDTWVLVTDDNVAPTANAFTEPEDLYFDQTISIDFSSTSINSVISILARHAGVVIELDSAVSGITTIKFSDVSASEVINLIAAVNGLTIKQNDGKILLGASDRKPESWTSAPAVLADNKGIELLGIIGNDNSRTAIINYQNMIMTVSDNTVIHGKFTVLAIKPDQIVIYDRATQKRDNIILER